MIYCFFISFALKTMSCELHLRRPQFEMKVIHTLYSTSHDVKSWNIINYFNIAQLFICPAPFLAEAFVSHGRRQTKRSESLCHIA